MVRNLFKSDSREPTSIRASDAVAFRRAGEVDVMNLVETRILLKGF